jgi:hypothetical protein
MPTFAADEYASIAERMKQLRDERAERLDRASAEAVLEQQMQRADEPVSLLGDPGDEDDLGPWNYASYYFGDVRL